MNINAIAIIEQLTAEADDLDRRRALVPEDTQDHGDRLWANYMCGQALGIRKAIRLITEAVVA